ncbi:MAG: hypothetical protein RIR26_202 [Pseudomonadota bacterium]|jgi:hypothetical protein
MIFRNLKHLPLCFSLVALGCQRSHMPATGCSGTMALVSDESALVKTPPAVPAGGFVNVGGRSCTATFLLQSASDSSLLITAYTAQHCFREDGSSAESVSLSLHLPAQGKTKAGYLKNLRATDEFYSRRQQFLSEVQKLGVSAASEMAKQAMDIALFADRGLERLDPNASDIETEQVSSSDNFRRNVCISSQTDRLTVPGSQHVCWSALDTTVRTLEIRSSEVNVEVYKSVRSFLESKKQSHEAVMNSSRNISKYFQLWNERVHAQVGGWRFRSYSNLAAFLNKDLCGKLLPSDDSHYPVCAVREPLLTAAKKYLVEVDSDGKKKSIIDKAQELGFGIDSPFLRSQAGSGSPQTSLKDLLMFKLSDDYSQFLNKNIADLKSMFPLKNEKIHALPKQFSIAANPVVRGGHGNEEMAFGLVDSSALVPSNSPVPSKGVQVLGILRMYLPSEQVKVRFGPTDSGAMLTIGGVVPLMVLNTVDDKPTSGGSAILALPEPGPEDDSVSENTSGNRSQKTSSNSVRTTSDTAVDSDSALVSGNSVACR